MKVQREVEAELYSLFNLSARWRWVVMPLSDHFTPGITRYPLYMRLGEAQDGRGKRRPHRDLFLGQSSPSRCTDYVNPPHSLLVEW